MGTVLKDRGQHAEAADLFARAVSLKPTLCEAYKNLGSCHTETVRADAPAPASSSPSRGPQAIARSFRVATPEGLLKARRRGGLKRRLASSRVRSPSTRSSGRHYTLCLTHSSSCVTGVRVSGGWRHCAIILPICTRGDRSARGQTSACTAGSLRSTHSFGRCRCGRSSWWPRTARERTLSLSARRRSAGR